MLMVFVASHCTPFMLSPQPLLAGDRLDQGLATAVARIDAADPDQVHRALAGGGGCDQARTGQTP